MYTTFEELAAVLDDVAAGILADAGVAAPPVDAFRVAQALGVAVALDDRQQGRARFVARAGYRGRAPQPTILLAPEPRSERRQWAVAHEIGEHSACHVYRALGIDAHDTGPHTREMIANQLANRLLLPAAWFAADARAAQWDLLELKRRYPTASHELIARRMLDLPPPILITIFDQDRLTFRRANLPGRVPPLSTAERQCQQAAHQANRPQETQSGLDTIQAWPVHEPEWKREIVRREVEESEDCRLAIED